MNIEKIPGPIREPKGRLAALLLALWVLSGILALATYQERWETLSLANREIVKDGGEGSKAWAVTLPPEVPLGYQAYNEKPSRLRIWFNGNPLPLPGADHMDVRALGQGRYQHFNNILLFSLPGNQDPRKYGNTLVVTYPQRAFGNLFLSTGLVFVLMSAYFLAVLALRFHLQRYWRLLVYGLVLFGLSGALALEVVSRADLFMKKESLLNPQKVAGTTWVCNFFTQRSLLFSLPEPLPFSQRKDLSHVSEGPVRLLHKGIPSWPHPVSPRETLQKGNGRYALSDAFLFFSFPADPATENPDDCAVRYPLRASWPVMILTGLLLAAWIGLRRPILDKPLGILATRGFSWVAMGLGAALLALNLSGWFLSLRGPEPSHDEAVQETTPSRMPLDEALDLLKKTPDETAETYCARAVDTVEKAMTTYFWDRGVRRYRLRVPPWENYLLTVMNQQLPLGPFGRYFFLDHRKGLERGVGLELQNCLVLAGFLRENGIKSEIVYTQAYYLVRAEVSPGVHHLLNPLLGLYFQQDVADVGKNPEPVIDSYRKAMSSLDPLVSNLWLPSIAHSFHKEKANVATPRAAFGEENALVEEWAYRLKWILPLGLLLAGEALHGLGRSRRRKKGEALLVRGWSGEEP